jgi:superfamily II DNA/RNA helicase
MVNSINQSTLDYKKSTKISLKDVQFLVLDEVDKMMSDPQDSKIIEEIFPKNEEKSLMNDIFPIPKPYHSIRKMLFSATLTSNPSVLAQLSRPQYFSLSQPYSKIKYVLPEKLNVRMLNLLKLSYFWFYLTLFINHCMFVNS